MCLQVFRALNGGLDGRDGVTIFTKLLNPKSIGNIRLKSANPFDHPLINPNYLSEQQDVDTLIDGNVFMSDSGFSIDVENKQEHIDNFFMSNSVNICHIKPVLLLLNNHNIAFILPHVTIIIIECPSRPILRPQ